MMWVVYVAIWIEVFAAAFVLVKAFRVIARLETDFEAKLMAAAGDRAEMEKARVQANEDRKLSRELLTAVKAWTDLREVADAKVAKKADEVATEVKEEIAKLPAKIAESVKAGDSSVLKGKP